MLLFILFGFILKNKNIEKVCIICNEPSNPDLRVGDHQKVCHKTYCKLQRKKLAQQKWLSKNPGYFNGRYLQLKEQILVNNKRKARSRKKACSSIQDKLT